MMEQLGLFGDENTLFNTGVQRFLDMDFGGCLDTLERYHKLSPWGQNARQETAMAEFWLTKLGGATWIEIDFAEAERRFRLWLEFGEPTALEWLAVRAQLSGIFERRVLRNMEEVKHWLQR
jgi:hypothetical protein